MIDGDVLSDDDYKGDDDHYLFGSDSSPPSPLATTQLLPLPAAVACIMCGEVVVEVHVQDSPRPVAEVLQWLEKKALNEWVMGKDILALLQGIAVTVSEIDNPSAIASSTTVAQSSEDIIQWEEWLWAVVPPAMLVFVMGQQGMTIGE